MVPTSRYPVSTFPNLAGTSAKIFAAIAALLFTITCIAQDNTQSQQTSLPDPQSSTQPQPQSSTITLPAGTRILLVLTHDIRSKSLRRGDDIYAQITSPVISGNQMVLRPGTCVQGTGDMHQQRR